MSLPLVDLAEQPETLTSRKADGYRERVAAVFHAKPNRWQDDQRPRGRWPDEVSAVVLQVRARRGNAMRETKYDFALAMRAFELFSLDERRQALEEFARLRYPSVEDRFFEAVDAVIRVIRAKRSPVPPAGETA